MTTDAEIENRKSKIENHLGYLLTAYLFNSLSAAGRREVETHLAGCAECRAELERLRATLSAAAKALDDGKQYVFEERRRLRVMEAAHASRRGVVVQLPPQPRHLRWLIPLASAVAMVAIVAAIATPTLLRSRMAANSTAAPASAKAFAEAEETYNYRAYRPLTPSAPKPATKAEEGRSDYGRDGAVEYGKKLEQKAERLAEHFEHLEAEPAGAVAMKRLEIAEADVPAKPAETPPDSGMVITGTAPGTYNFGSRPPQGERKIVVKRHGGSVSASPPPPPRAPRATLPEPLVPLPYKVPAPAPKRSGGGGCFLAGTDVLTEDGLRPIEMIPSGASVWAADPLTGQWTLKPVIEPLRHDYAGDVITIEAGGVTIEATGNHPFWVESGRDLASRPAVSDIPAAERALTAAGRWIAARDLQAGDVLRTFDSGKECPGSSPRVGEGLGEGIVERLSVRHARTPVYNLTVADLHTYAVSSAGILVHNKESAAYDEPPALPPVAAPAPPKPEAPPLVTILRPRLDTSFGISAGNANVAPAAEGGGAPAGPGQGGGQPVAGGQWDVSNGPGETKDETARAGRVAGATAATPEEIAELKKDVAQLRARQADPQRVEDAKVVTKNGKLSVGGLIQVWDRSIQDGENKQAGGVELQRAEKALEGAEKDNFLSSFNGDIDTKTSLGRGLEHAKVRNRVEISAAIDSRIETAIAGKDAFLDETQREDRRAAEDLTKLKGVVLKQQQAVVVEKEKRETAAQEERQEAERMNIPHMGYAGKPENWKEISERMGAIRQPPPKAPTSGERADIVVPKEILDKVELGDRIETVNPDRPDTESAFGKLGSYHFHSVKGSDYPAGGGGVDLAGNSDKFALNITDAAGKINVNTAENLAVQLDNLARNIETQAGTTTVISTQDNFAPANQLDIRVNGNPANADGRDHNIDGSLATTTLSAAPQPYIGLADGTYLKSVPGAAVSMLEKTGRPEDLAAIDRAFAGVEGAPSTATPKAGYVFTHGSRFDGDKGKFVPEFDEKNIGYSLTPILNRNIGGGELRLSNDAMEWYLRGYRYFRAQNKKLTFTDYYERPASVPPAPITDEGLDEDAYIEKYGTRPFVDCARDHLSTFGLDVDTASYTLARSRLREGEGQLPERESVRAEEFLNYFKQPYTVSGDDAFGVFAEAAPSPFSPLTLPSPARGEGNNISRRELLKIGIKSRDPRPDERKPAMLTFVVDMSGSMNRSNRLDLVRGALSELVAGLKETDAVAIVGFGDQAQLVLPRTQARQRQRILDAIATLEPRGATNVEAGLNMGYRLADEAYSPDAVNRVILCSDGVANVGAKGPDEILKLVKVFADRGVDLSTVGFGMGQYNDQMMMRLADSGNGSCHFVDSLAEAKKIFREQLPPNLNVLARDAKAQVEFNPDVIERYRLIGYEKRKIADKDFRNDKIDAGEVAHSTLITVMYEIVRKPAGHGPLGKVFLRWKDAGARHLPVIERNYPLSEGIVAADLRNASPNLRFLACVARFAELLRESPWARDGSYYDVLRQLHALPAEFQNRAEWKEVQELVTRAQALSVKKWVKEL